MNSFQIIVLSIFVILAILVLTGFAIMLNSKKDDDSEYPSSYNTCPDYWDVSLNPTGTKCVMSGSINNGITGWENAYVPATNAGTPGFENVDYQGTNKFHVDFNDPKWNDIKYPGVSGRCSLKKWATDNGIVWDGVTNYNSAYC
jgi:hypothetical protein